MKKRFIKRFALALLSLCFAASTVSASYHDCSDPQSAKQAEATAGMNCHKEMNASIPAPQTEKKCCIDFSCPKCFSSPLANARMSITERVMISLNLPLAITYHHFSHSPSALERPPKMA